MAANRDVIEYPLEMLWRHWGAFHKKMSRVRNVYRNNSSNFETRLMVHSCMSSTFSIASWMELALSKKINDIRHEATCDSPEASINNTLDRNKLMIFPVDKHQFITEIPDVLQQSGEVHCFVTVTVKISKKSFSY